MIYTSYFRKYDWFKQNKPYYKLFSIARYSPSWINIDSIPILAPSLTLLRDIKDDKITEDEYTEQYTNQLDNIANLTQFMIELEEVYSTPVLFCYETSDRFCHRHILSNYVNDLLGYELIKEYKFD